MKKLLSAMMLVVLVCALVTPVAAAASGHGAPAPSTFFSAKAPSSTVNVHNGDDITIVENVAYILDAGAAATLRMASGATALVNTTISCQAGSTLTLVDVNIDVSLQSGLCALAFTGAGNTLVLSGESTLKSGDNEPGISADDTTTLIIRGDGIVNAYAGLYGAGIGGGLLTSSGIITINSGIINTQGDYGAGIGGGYAFSDLTIGGGTTTINGGTISATTINYGAGIGGGDFGKCGIVIITGGTVTATGTTGSAGIGSGWDGSNTELNQVTITGGTVTATGNGGAAGIGGGMAVDGGDVTIEGTAIVYASANLITMDIGNGINGTDEGTLLVTDDAVVFARANSIPVGTVLGANHIAEVAASAGVINLYGPLPASWSGASGNAIYVPYNVIYRANGGSGTTADASRPHPSGSAAAINNSFTRSGYTFSSWNTADDGSAALYRAGNIMPVPSEGMILYAMWAENTGTNPQTSDASQLPIILLATVIIMLLGSSSFAMIKRKAK